MAMIACPPDELVLIAAAHRSEVAAAPNISPTLERGSAMRHALGPVDGVDGGRKMNSSLPLSENIPLNHDCGVSIVFRLRSIFKYDGPIRPRPA